MSAALEQRVRQYRSRMLIRAWHYRQRRHAHGVWFGLRRLLADTRQAYAISATDAERLRAEGFRIEPLGLAIEPPKSIVFAPASRIITLASAMEIPVSLGEALLNARYLALVPFDAVQDL